MTQPAPAPTYGGIDVPVDVWGLDAAVTGILTDAQLQALAAFDLGTLKIPGYLPLGRPVVLWGYAPLPGMHSSWDWTGERLRAACDAGFLCGVVQHCRSGMWTASKDQGTADGICAAAFATSIGYPKDCHLVMDDEAVRNPGPDAFAHVCGWADAARQANPPAIYEGFAPGLTPEQEYEVPAVDRYWGAMGPWDVATRSVCCRQGPTVRVNGVAYDLDHFFADRLGGVLRLMGRLDLHPDLTGDPLPDDEIVDIKHLPPPGGG